MVVDLVEECEWAMIRNIHFNNVLRVLEIAIKVTWGQCYNFRRFSAKQIGVFLKSQWCIPGNNSLSCPSRVQFISQCLCFVWSNSNKVSPNEGRSNKTVAPHWRQKSRQKGGPLISPGTSGTMIPEVSDKNLIGCQRRISCWLARIILPTDKTTVQRFMNWAIYCLKNWAYIVMIRLRWFVSSGREIYCWRETPTAAWLAWSPSLRPILNFDPRGKLWPQGRSCPGGWNFC
jgi:hypothetical protein